MNKSIEVHETTVSIDRSESIESTLLEKKQIHAYLEPTFFSQLFRRKKQTKMTEIIILNSVIYNT